MLSRNSDFGALKAARMTVNVAINQTTGDPEAFPGYVALSDAFSYKLAVKVMRVVPQLAVEQILELWLDSPCANRR